MLDRDEKTIRKHINNIFKDREVEKENNTQKMRVVGVKQSVPKWNKFKLKATVKWIFIMQSKNTRDFSHEMN